MRFSPLLALALIVTFVACGPQTESEVYDAAVGAQRQEKFDEAIDLFERLLEDFPQSDRIPDAYYALGVMYQDQKQDYPKAIEMYTALFEKYPDSPTASNALFMTGFLQHNEMKDLEKARILYQQFLDKYPDSQLAPSARFELENLGKDPSELFSETNG